MMQSIRQLIKERGDNTLFNRSVFPLLTRLIQRRPLRPLKLGVRKYAWLAAGLLCLHGVQAQDIDYVNANFSVEYNNKLTQGENRLSIQREQKQYKINFGLDHWLLSSHQTAVFTMEQCQAQPLSYTSTAKRPLKDESTQTLNFDWQQKKATFQSDGEHKSFDLDTALYDPLSFFFEARCDLIAGKTAFSYPLIHKGNKKTHHYKVVGIETVETGQGQVDALVIERERESKSRQTRLYVAPSLDYLLVKIEHQESRLLKIVATLKSMDYQLINH